MSDQVRFVGILSGDYFTFVSFGIEPADTLEAVRKAVVLHNRQYPDSAEKYDPEAVAILPFDPVFVERLGGSRIPVDGHPHIKAYVNSPWHKGQFTIDDQHVYPGFAQEDDWNGWALPCFEREQAEKILQDYQIIHEYDLYGDRFITRPDDDPDFPDIVRGWDLVIGAEIHRVYSLGAGQWIWDEVKE